MDKDTFIRFEEVKKAILELDNIVNNKMRKKVIELNDIVDHIQENWRGANAERYKKEVEDIINAIDEFRNNYLLKEISNIEAQSSQYSKYEQS
jgi:uncharacterized protein YukE